MSEPNLSYLFAAFGITWLGFFAYLYVVSRRERELRREIEELRRVLAQQQGSSAPGSAGAQGGRET